MVKTIKRLEEEIKALTESNARHRMMWIGEYRMRTLREAGHHGESISQPRWDASSPDVHCGSDDLLEAEDDGELGASSDLQRE